MERRTRERVVVPPKITVSIDGKILPGPGRFLIEIIANYRLIISHNLYSNP
jgi:hypothetical protein